MKKNIVQGIKKMGDDYKDKKAQMHFERIQTGKEYSSTRN